MKNLYFKRIFSFCMTVCLVLSCLMLASCKNNSEDGSEYSYYTYFVPGSEDGSGNTGDASNTDGGAALLPGSGGSAQTGNSGNSGNSGGNGGSGNSGGSGSTGNSGGNINPTGNYDPYASMPNLSGKTIKLYLWYQPEAQEQAIIDAFTKKFGIKVDITVTTWEDFLPKLSTAIAVNNGPDVVPMTSNRFPTMFTKNLVQPLDSIKDSGFDLKNDPAFDIQQMDLFKWNGKYYGVNIKGSNLSCDMAVMLYNKTIFANEGVKDPGSYWKEKNWNWDTFLEAAQAVTKPNKNQYGFGIDNKSFFMLSAGTDYIKLTTANNRTSIKSNLTDPILTEAWQFYVDLRDKYKVDPGKDDNIGDFYSGRVAMYADSQYVMSKNSDVAKNMKDDWGVVPFPSPKGTNLLATQSRLWCVALNAKQPAAATYFIRYFIDPQNGSGTESWWAKKEFQSVYESMVNMSKFSLRSQGIIGFNDANDYYALQSVAAFTDRDQISSALKGQESWLNSIITQVENEIPKK